MKRGFFNWSSLVAMAVLLCTAVPASAQQWVQHDYTYQVVSEGNTAGGGYGIGGSGSTHYEVIAVADFSGLGNIASGGIELKVERQFEKVGNPVDRLVFLTMNISGSTGVNVGAGGAGYATSRAIANGTASFPNSDVLDEDANAAQPAGMMADSFSDTNDNRAIGPRTRQLNATTTLEGNIYAYAETGTNANPVTNQGAEAFADIYLW